MKKIFICIIVNITFFSCVNGKLIILDQVEWKKELESNCNNVWLQISSHIDTTLSNKLKYQCIKCALIKEDVLLARRYFNLIDKDQIFDRNVKDILEARILVQEKNEVDAVKLLMKISNSLPLQKLFEIKEFQYLKNNNTFAARLYFEALPSLNIFTFFILATCFIGVLFAIAILFNKQMQRGTSKWLSSLIIAICLIMTSFVLYWSKFSIQYPYFNGWWQSLYYLIGPLFYMYISSLFTPNMAINKNWIHFIPFLMVSVLITNTGEVYHIKPWIDSILPTIIATSLPLKIFHLSIYLIFSYQLMKGDWEMDKRVYTWCAVILIFYLIFILANLIYYLLSFWNGFNTQWDYFISGIMAFGIIGIAFMGFMEPQYLQFNKIHEDLLPIFISDHLDGNNSNTPSLENQIAKYETSNLTLSAANSIRNQLDIQMNEKMIFKNNNLRLQDLADEIGVSRHHLSQVINKSYGLSFFEWVNTYRIKYAIQLFQKTSSTYSIEEVAYLSGFNNKVSFYNSFKQHFKCTPSEYLKSRKQN